MSIPHTAGASASGNHRALALGISNHFAVNWGKTSCFFAWPDTVHVFVQSCLLLVKELPIHRQPVERSGLQNACLHPLTPGETSVPQNARIRSFKGSMLARFQRKQMHHLCPLVSSWGDPTRAPQKFRLTYGCVSVTREARHRHATGRHHAPEVRSGGGAGLSGRAVESIASIKTSLSLRPCALQLM